MKNNPKKIRITIEMDVDIDTEEYPDITEEEVRKAVVIQNSDVIDGFEITTNHPRYDNTCDFFLSNGVIVKKELISAEEHRQEVDEVTDMITAEDVVEQAVYMANAPECCADDHAENILGMLGANVVDEEIYHDEDECPKLGMGGV